MLRFSHHFMWRMLRKKIRIHNYMLRGFKSMLLFFRALQNKCGHRLYSMQWRSQKFNEIELKLWWLNIFNFFSRVIYSTTMMLKSVWSILYQGIHKITITKWLRGSPKWVNERTILMPKSVESLIKALLAIDRVLK